jgi:hypothetical protein
MAGSIAPNLHEGSRSEYLAQYIFASFGTAVAVPHQEDTGVDLYCTLTERIGQRARPSAYFSVQVKSTMDPWILEGADSVRWLIEHPLPFFLCVVDKGTARLRVYHTSPRFYVWSLPPLPGRLELVPTNEEIGRATQWEGSDERLSLRAPILDASVHELLDDDFHRNAWRVLKFWIDIDLENLVRVKNGIYSFRMPSEYRANHPAALGGWDSHFITGAPDLSSLRQSVKDSVAYLSSQLYVSGDLPGAIRCALLLRQLFKDDSSILTHNPQLHDSINNLVRGTVGYQFAGVDLLNAMVDEKLGQAELSLLYLAT